MSASPQSDTPHSSDAVIDTAITSQSQLLSPDVPVTLTNCDMEPIHIPGSIQPHGLLLAARMPELQILYASENTREFLGIDAASLLGEPLHRLLSEQAVASIGQALCGKYAAQNSSMRLAPVRCSGTLFDLSFHPAKGGPSGLLIVEMQPALSERYSATATARINLCTRQLDCPASLDHLLELVVPVVRRETGYDRTMVYRFNEDGHGEILAEDKEPEIEPLLGLHYPATDIPRQARQLYMMQRLRAIVDSTYTPVRILADRKVVEDEPLDMTYCFLRSVSPMHVEYLKNMGVAGALSISLVVDNRLWGLIVCHHRCARNPDAETLAVCEHLGAVVSLLIALAQKADADAERLRKQSLLEQLGERLQVDTSLTQVLADNAGLVLALTGAAGALISADDQKSLIGQTPPLDEAEALMSQMYAREPDAISSCDAVGAVMPQFAHLALVTSGVLFAPCKPPTTGVLWFRPEVTQTVHWGGNPYAAKELVPATMQLSPRRSFAVWTEVQQGRSSAWTAGEMEAATALQNKLARQLLRQAVNRETGARADERQLATEIVGIGIWDWNINTGEVTWDARMYQIHGLTPTPGVVRSDEIFRRNVHPEDLPGAERAIQAAVDQHQPFIHEYRVVWSDGSVHYICSMGRVICDNAGQPLRMVGTNTDVTRQKEAEESLRKATLLAEQANRAKSEFLANMSHEVRTPMNAIMGITELAMQANPGPQQQNYLGKIANAAKSLLGIVNDILDFSKMEAGKLELEHIPFSLAAILKRLVDTLGLEAQEKGLDLLFEVQRTTSVPLLGDPLRVGQILINLVNNAIKFTHSGRIVIRVGFEREGHGTHLRFAVSDSGIGMTEQQVASLFQSFYQADPSFTRTVGGTGLGLAISKKLVERMGGDITITSELGKGTTVTFSVFCSEAEEGRSTVDAAFAAKLAQATILVVDDNQLDRQSLSQILRPLGSRIITATSGEEVIEVIVGAVESGTPVDVVLMDWRLPGLDGLEAARRIKANEKLSYKPAVVLISGFEREEVMTYLNDPALDGFLIKPVEEALLMNTLNGVLGDADGRVGRGPQGVTTRYTGRRVLLVEDNEINREIAAEMLRGLGVSVTVAVNGREALDLASSESFDLILMDIQMPVMDGLAATKLIRADPELCNLPIVALTAHAMSGDRERSLMVGMNDHVVKPIDLETLSRALRRWMPEKAVSCSAPVTSPVHFRSLAQYPVQPFDMHAALERASGNAALLRRMLTAFCDHFAGAGAELRTLVAKGETEDAAKLAHTLKGSAATLSACALAEAASDLQSALGAKRMAKLPALLNALDTELTAALAAASVWNPAADPSTELAAHFSGELLEQCAQQSPQSNEKNRADAALRPAVLLVEDDASTLQLLQATFDRDYNLLFATNGECAIELASSKSLDLILLDITLPGMDGFEVCRRLKKAPRTGHIPVIFITGADDPDSEVRALSSGAMDYVTKPIEPAVIKERVRNQIKFKRAQEHAQIEAASQVAQSRARLQEVLDSTSDGVLEIGPQWTVLYGNRQAAALLEDFKVGDDLWICFPALCTTPVQEQIRDAMETRRELRQETFYGPEDRWYRFCAFPVSDGMSVFFSDCSVEKNLERQVSLERLLKEERVERLGYMAAGLAHEINNPLAMIHSLASDSSGLLNDGASLPPETLKKTFDNILQSSDRAIKTLRGLRGFAGEVSKEPLEMISIAEIVDTCIQALQQECARHRIELRVEVNPQVPRVLCRKVQIDQIVSNLLNNAVEAIVTSNPPERWISVRADREQNSACIDVTDCGAVMHDALDAYLTAPAYSRKEAGDGLHIGLGLSRMIAEDHHGSLSLLDRSGTSCFRLSLPILPEYEKFTAHKNRGIG